MEWDCVPTDFSCLAQSSLLFDGNEFCGFVMPHLAQHLGELFPRLGSEIVAEMLRLLLVEPSNAAIRVGRRITGNAVITEPVERQTVPLRPTLGVVDERVYVRCRWRDRT